MEIAMRLLERVNTTVLIWPLLLILIVILLWKSNAARKSRPAVTAKSVSTAPPAPPDLYGGRKLSEDIALLSENMDIIRDYFATRHLTIRSGPVTLSDKGLEIRDETDAKSIFSKIYPQLKIMLVARGPLTPYDIQAVALDTAKQNFISMLSAEELGTLKQTAYKNGLTLDSLYIIFGIMLRDAVLKERKIQIDSLSARDPNIKK
ncbi:MAG: hypothetical protein LBI01_03500 [Elusimicrobium sp.]|jgi:hypothetical protein|nr:hypothetical protein [Elusimicrobium sp.]